MSVRVLNDVFEHSQATGNDRIVLLVLADHAHDDGGSAYPSHKTIAHKAGGIGERTVRDCLSRLQKMGEIDREGWSPKHTISYRVTVATRQVLPGSTRQPDVSNPADLDANPADSRIPSKQVNHQEPSIEPGGLLPSPEQEVFDHWHAALSKNGNTRLDDTRRRKIKARLAEALTVDDLKAAIDGFVATADFHLKRGKERNRSGPVYDDLAKYVLRDRPTVEKWVAAANSDRARPDYSEYDATEN